MRRPSLHESTEVASEPRVTKTLALQGRREQISAQKADGDQATGGAERRLPKQLALPIPPVGSRRS